MPFRTALSGLNASSAELRVIGNNVANASTTGFKKSRTEFQDIYATASLGAASNTIGSGVKIGGITQQFSQGNVSFTDNNLDIAISGQGFFQMNDNGVTAYSRNGTFGIDRNGFIVNSQNQRLNGYIADSSGNVTGAIADIQLNTAAIAPQATSTVDLGVNLNASASIAVAPVPSSVFTLGSVGANPVLDTGDSPIAIATGNLIDTYGQTVAGANVQFTSTGGNNWNVTMTGISGTSTTAAITVGTTGTATLTWDPDGAGGAQVGTPITVDVSAVTQVGGGGATDVTSAANGAVQSAFSATDASTYNNSTSLTVYDSLGASHLATYYYRKTGIPNQWESYMLIDGNQVNGAQSNGSDLMQFTSAGALTTINGTSVPPATLNTSTFSPGGGAANMALALNYANVSQYGGGFNVNDLSQNGFSTGRLSGIDIDDSGVILARFTNGQSRTLAQIALANFSNTQGLQQQGDVSWTETFESGQAIVGVPGSSSLGLVQSGALEGSNVDLTEQLVNMITAQRNFQANAQVISTADTVTQAIINIR